jgi:predicted alpha/beta hydrolase family esterase
MNAIICHGTQGSPTGNWFQWLAQKLRDLGVDAYTPRLPTPEGQSLTAWLAAIEEQCPPVTEHTILIGHSSGAVLCMRILEMLRLPVKCTALISPPLTEIGLRDIDALNASFLSSPFDWSVIRRNAGELVYLMGDDDQYVPQDQLRAIAKGLAVEPVVIHGGGHLNAETGYVTFPELLVLLEEVLR